jgi:hypothetical protein
MSTPTRAPETPLPTDRREIRARIARLRRRIDGHLHRAEGHGRRLLSWRTYVTRYPLLAAGAALGLGLLVSARVKPNVLVRWFGRYMLRGAQVRMIGLMGQEFAGLWDVLKSHLQAGRGADATAASAAATAEEAQHATP